MKYRKLLFLWTFGFFSLVHTTSHLAYADTKKGKRLVIDISCLDRLYIGTRSSLEGSIENITPWPNGLQISTDSKGTISLKRTTCPDGGFLNIVTAPQIPIIVQNAGNAAITIASHLEAPVAVHVGNGPALLGTAQELDVFSHASGPITIPLFTTSARIHSTGSAVITIQRVQATALFLFLGGTSRFIAKTGHIKALEIVSKSSKDAIFHGESGVTALYVLGKGNITVDTVNGSIATERDGPGKIFYTPIR